jgi:hypothetical protein
MNAAHRAGGRLVRHAQIVAGTAAALMLALSVLAVPALLSLDASRSDLILWPTIIAFVVSGWVLAVRLPANAVGWLLLLTSVGMGLLPASAICSWLITHGVDAGRWIGGASGVFFVFIVGGLALLLPLLFPDGQLPSRRPWWRIVLWCDLGYMFFASFNLFDPGALDLPGLHGKVQNPFAMSGLAAVVAVCVPMMFIGFAGSFSSVYVRWRGAGAGQREQMKWVILALAVAPVPFLLHDTAPAASNVAMAVVLPLVPITVAVSVLRYRLYDIDRILSRAVAYLLVTGTLVGIYVAFIAIADVLVPTDGGSVAVAASTLAAAALFQPLRRRVQARVDHRFNRARYDAARTIDGFAARLRDEVDVDVVRDDLLDVASRAVQPASLSLWVAS